MASLCMSDILDIGSKNWRGHKAEVGSAMSEAGAPMQFMLPSVDDVRISSMKIMIRL